MIFILWLVSFTISELLLSHMRILALVVPLLFVVVGVCYLISKNKISGRGDVVAYEKKIRILTTKLHFLYSIIMIISLCVMVNMVSRMFLL